MATITIAAEKLSDLTPICDALRAALVGRRLLKCVVKDRERSLVYEMVKSDPINRSITVTLNGNYLFALHRSSVHKSVTVSWYSHRNTLGGPIEDCFTHNKSHFFLVLEKFIPGHGLKWIHHYEMKTVAFEIRAIADKRESLLQSTIKRWEKEGAQQ